MIDIQWHPQEHLWGMTIATSQPSIGTDQLAQFN